MTLSVCRRESTAGDLAGLNRDGDRFQDGHSNGPLEALLNVNLHDQNRNVFVFNKTNTGPVSCARWSGFASYFSNSDANSGNIFTTIANTWSAFNDWNSRCDDANNGEFEFLKARMKKLIAKHLNALPPCEAARTLAPVPGPNGQ